MTNGHVWMMKQAAKLGELHIAIAANPAKKYTFSEEERMYMLREVLDAEIPSVSLGVHVITNTYLADFAYLIGVDMLVRGLRNEADFAYERQMRHVNAKLAPDIGTVFFMPPQDLEFVSSSFVKGMIGPEGWQGYVRNYVPTVVFKQLVKKFSNDEVSKLRREGDK